MLDYIYRLVTGFEREHGMRPNLLCISPEHCGYLKSSFDEKYSMHEIMSMLQLEIMIDPASVHPHVCWSPAAHRLAS